MAVVLVRSNDPPPDWNGFLLIDPRRPMSEQQPRRAMAPKGLNFVPNSWSADGRLLVGQPGYDKTGVVVYSVADATFTPLTDIGEWPVWLPDSRRVMAVVDGREFHIIDTRTKSSRVVFSVSRDTLGPPRLTRDGRSAFFSRRMTEADVWIVDLQGR